MSRVFDFSPQKKSHGFPWDFFLFCFLAVVFFLCLFIQLLLKLRHQILAEYLVRNDLIVIDLKEGFPVHCFITDQILRDTGHLLHMLGQELLTGVVRLLDNTVDLIVDLRCLDLGVALPCRKITAQEYFAP